MHFVIKYLIAVPRGSGDWPKWNLRGLAIYNIDIGFGTYRGFHLRSARPCLNYVSISVAKHVMLRYTAYMYIQSVWRNAIYFSYFPTICNNIYTCSNILGSNAFIFLKMISKCCVRIRCIRSSLNANVVLYSYHI